MTLTRTQRISINIVLLVAIVLLLISLIYPVQPHNHKQARIPYANDIKPVYITVCGDSAQVLKDGTHIPISEQRLNVIKYEKPE